MVKCEYVIYQRVNSVLDRLNFRVYSQRLWEQFPNQLIAPRTNAQIMSTADNNNDYNYDQGIGIEIYEMKETHQVWIRSLVTSSGSEV